MAQITLMDKASHSPKSLTMSGLASGETAAQRALGLLEIVDHIASHVQSEFWSTEEAEPKSAWLESGQLARGVNSLWKRTFDKRMLLGASIPGSRTHLHLQRIPKPGYRILAANPDLLNAISEIRGHLGSYPATMASILVSICAENLTDLKMNEELLVALSAQFQARPYLRFDLVRTLVVDFTEYGIEDYDMDTSDDASELIASFTGIKTLHITLCSTRHTDETRDILPCQQLLLVTSFRCVPMDFLHLVILSDLPYSGPQLASILGHFTPLPCLWLDLFQVTCLKDVLPHSLRWLRVQCAAATMVHVLSVLADESDIPHLCFTPQLSYIETRFDEISRPAITLRMVEKAIEGLEERGGVVDLETEGPQLYELVRHEGW